MSSKELWRTLSESHRATHVPNTEPIAAEPEDPRIEFPNQPAKLKFIEGLRGLAALYVALGHLCTMVDPAKFTGRHDGSTEAMRRFVSCFGYGHLAVAIFIVISGFSLQLSLFTSGDGTLKDLKRFYMRRVRRILPTYYACLAFSIAVALLFTGSLAKRYGDPFGWYLPVNLTTVSVHLLLIQNWSKGWMYTINGVLWSIAIEAQLYVVFPAIVRGLNRIGRTVVLCAATIAAVAALNLFSEASKLYVWYLPLFVTGMVAAHLAYRPHLRYGVVPGLALVLGGVLSLAGIRSCIQGVHLPAQDGLFGVATACALYAMTVMPQLLMARALSARLLTFVGGFSYSLYLMHHPIEQAMFWLKPVSVHGKYALLYQFGVSLPVVMIGTWLFSLVFEKPFIPSASRSKRTASDDPSVEHSVREFKSGIVVKDEPLRKLV